MNSQLYIFDNKEDATTFLRNIYFSEEDKDVEDVYTNLTEDYKKCVFEVLRSFYGMKDHFGYNLKMFISSMTVEEYYVNTHSIAEELLGSGAREKEIRMLYKKHDFFELKHGSLREDIVNKICENFSVSLDLFIYGLGEIYDIEDTILEMYKKDSSDKVNVGTYTIGKKKDGTERRLIAKWLYLYERENPFKRAPANATITERNYYKEQEKLYNDEFKTIKLEARFALNKYLQLYEEYLKSIGKLDRDKSIFKKRWAVIAKTGMYEGLNFKNKEVIKTLIYKLYAIQQKRRIDDGWTDEFVIY